jgi:hypothetical protein
MIKELPPQDRLAELFKYDSASGTLYWMPRTSESFGGSSARARAWNDAHSGKPALNGVNSDGYRVGKMASLGGVKAHRVVWKLLHGFDAENVDHINGIRSDNRAVNLRAVSADENARNLGLSANNTSGFNGVYWFPNYQKWMASIRVNGRRKTLGYFSEKSEAVAARREADKIAGYSTWRAR